MGVWGVEAFSNDDAADWLFALYESDDLSVIDKALSRVVSTAGYLEAPESMEGIAAAEVVARLKGRPDPKTLAEEELHRWISGIKLKPDADLTKKALATIDRILTAPSELLELWQESTEFDDWKTSLLNLKQRISA
jgi:hypothetical protein